MTVTANAAAAVVIDDDPDVRSLLVDVLRGAGFDTVDVNNGADGIAAVREHTPVITTVDVDMPGIDGFETVRRIREISSTIVVIITAANDEASAVLAFGVGADDVVVKPFRARELRARLGALTRRSQGAPLPRVPAQSAMPEGLRINRSARTVAVDGGDISLTRSEFDLLVTLFGNPGHVLSRADLVTALYGDDYIAPGGVTSADERAIETHITNLRKKLGQTAANPRFIETVRGVGYRAIMAGE